MKSIVFYIIVLTSLMSCGETANRDTSQPRMGEKNDTAYYQIEIKENFETESSKKLDTVSINWDHNKEFHYLTFGKFDLLSQLRIYDERGPRLSCFTDYRLKSLIFNPNEEIKMQIENLDQYQFIRKSWQFYEIHLVNYTDNFAKAVHAYRFILKIKN